jgi:KaiC/GvpD/RAD55 family RecA-like ATPase
MSESRLIDLCGSRIDRAAQAAVALWKSLWVAALKEQTGPSPTAPCLVVRLSTVEECLTTELAEDRCHLRDMPEDQKADLRAALLISLGRIEGADSIQIPQSLFCAFDLVAMVLSGEAETPDLAYFTARELRRRNRVLLSSSLMRAVQIYVARLSLWIDSHAEPDRLNYARFLLATQIEGSGAPAQSQPPPNLTADAFFELVSAAGWVSPGGRPGEILIDHSRFDGEALIEQYFSLPTAIPGFDSLFGGWGPILLDAPEFGPGARNDGQSIGARTVLVTGPYGTGKSTLTLQMAIDVARKGGVTIMAAMEQSAEECLYAMEALGIPTSSDRFDVVHEIGDAMPLLSQKYDGRGMLAFLPIRSESSPAPSDSVTAGSHTDSTISNFDRLIAAALDRLNWVSRFPLRLLVVDPINTVLDEDRTQRTKRRRQLDFLFKQAKRRGVNIWIISERNSERAGEPFEENIADTVLHLGIDRTQPNQHRTIQVRKSRLQREEPGTHTVVMLPHQGIRIYPSSTAVARSTKPRRENHTPRLPVSFNVDGLDPILGAGAVLRGDVIALDGAPGSSRTLVGLHFLFGDGAGAHDERTTSLFVSDSDEIRMNSLINLVEAHAAHHTKSGADIRLCSLQAGMVEPSQILQAIDDQFQRARRQGRPIDRVMVADLSRWELSMPMLREDAAFGAALLGVLRRWGATSVLLADYVSGNQASLLTDLIVNNADCALQFDKLEFRGQIRQLVRVTKSHTLDHRRDAFELIVGSGGLRVEPYGALLRRDSAGIVHPVKIRLFLHADSPHHQEFNDRLVGAINTSISTALVGEPLSNYDPEIFRLTASSAIDEVQVMQLDEFQLPDPGDAESDKRFCPLRPTSQAQAAYGRAQYLGRLAKRIGALDDGKLIALPFYENISLLAYNQGRLNTAVQAANNSYLARFRDENGDINLSRARGRDAWEALRICAVKWDTEAIEKGEERLFFSCPMAQPDTVETYNCLFFEMLHAYRGKPEGSNCRLADWLKGKAVKEAAYAFRDLCYRSHRHETEFFKSCKAAPGQRKLRTFDTPADSGQNGPVVWRHWYNTLSQMMWDLNDEERSQTRVLPLFDDVTTAGEWYLVVPAYSAAPELAWQIIQMVTAPDRELQRIYRGVGLPTRRSYYSQSSQPLPVSPVSPFFHISRTKLGELVNNAFQRSQFPCYQQFAETVSAHLQRILELPPQDWQVMHDQIDTVVDHLGESIRYIQESALCRACRERNASGPPDDCHLKSVSDAGEEA